MAKYNASNIIENLGDDRLIQTLGFTARNLRHIRATGKFPGSWYVAVRALCDEHGVFCPLSAFSWRAGDKKHGTNPDNFQGAAE